MKIDLDWGDVNRHGSLKLTVSATSDKKTEWGVQRGCVFVTVRGRSGHNHGDAEVTGNLELRREEVYHLFEAAVKSANCDPAVKRLAKAALRELKAQDIKPT